MKGGEQFINLDRNKECVKSKGTFLRQILHALGFFNMQMHPRRDEYIRVFWENIPINRKHTARKVRPNLHSNFNTPYDFASVMHSAKFAGDGKRFFVAKPKYKAFEALMGQASQLSEGDVKRINNMYECNRTDKEY